jgi:hypothetical protein
MRVCVYWGGCRYPTRWEGNSIVVLDQYIIKAPYQAENIVLIRDRDGTTDGLNRLTKVVRIYIVVCLTLTNSFLWFLNSSWAKERSSEWHKGYDKQTFTY